MEKAYDEVRSAEVKPVEKIVVNAAYFDANNPRHVLEKPFEF